MNNINRCCKDIQQEKLDPWEISHENANWLTLSNSPQGLGDTSRKVK